MKDFRLGANPHYGFNCSLVDNSIEVEIFDNDDKETTFQLFYLSNTEAEQFLTWLQDTMLEWRIKLAEEGKL